MENRVEERKWKIVQRKEKRRKMQMRYKRSISRKEEEKARKMTEQEDDVRSYRLVRFSVWLCFPLSRVLNKKSSSGVCQPLQWQHWGVCIHLCLKVCAFLKLLFWAFFHRDSKAEREEDMQRGCSSDLTLLLLSGPTVTGSPTKPVYTLRSLINFVL